MEIQQCTKSEAHTLRKFGLKIFVELGSYPQPEVYFSECPLKSEVTKKKKKVVLNKKKSVPANAILKLVKGTVEFAPDTLGLHTWEVVRSIMEVGDKITRGVLAKTMVEESTRITNMRACCAISDLIHKQEALVVVPRKPKKKKK